LPLNMDGTHGPQARGVEKLGAALAATCDLPITYWDERLSSFIAEQRLAEAPRRRSRHADDLAAAIILQSYLDARAAGGAT
jgi:putative Holliday junction resolvase